MAILFKWKLKLRDWKDLPSLAQLARAERHWEPKPSQRGWLFTQPPALNQRILWLTLPDFSSSSLTCWLFLITCLQLMLRDSPVHPSEEEDIFPYIWFLHAPFTVMPLKGRVCREPWRWCVRTPEGCRSSEGRHMLRVQPALLEGCAMRCVPTAPL